MERSEFLKRTPLFAELNDKEIDGVLNTAKERSFSAGDHIIKQGSEGGRAFYLLLSGSAEVRKGDTQLASYGPGDYFGEMSLLLEDTPRTADVVSTGDTTCLAITQWDLKALIKSHPEVGVKIMAELARRLHNNESVGG